MGISEIKKCSCCKEFKEYSKFNKNKSSFDGLQNQCKDCRAQRYIKNPLTSRNSQLKQKFGISQDEYYQHYLKQDGRCAICGDQESAFHKTNNKIKTLAVDHDHKTNVIRGLLCQKCNIGIGHFNDNPNLLMEAVLYLDRYRNTQGTK